MSDELYDMDGSVSDHVLVPRAGSRFFPAPSGKAIDTMANRFDRHFHNWYGLSEYQCEPSGELFDEHTIPSRLWATVFNNPYLEAAKNARAGLSNDITDADEDEYEAQLGRLHYCLNPLAPISILLIQGSVKMSDYRNSARDDDQKAALFFMTVAQGLYNLFLRFPIGIVATVINIVADPLAGMLAAAISAITAGLSQAAALINDHKVNGPSVSTVIEPGW